jgi:hypothetical protein
MRRLRGLIAGAIIAARVPHFDSAPTVNRLASLFLGREAPMPIFVSEWATSQEISNRIDRLRMQYAGNPLVKRIDHHIGVDWSDDPAVFIDVILPGKIAAPELERLAEAIRVDLLRLVRTDEIGLHSYLNFVN